MTPCVDELQRAHELAEPVGIRGLTWAPEISHQEMVEMQNEDEVLQPVIQRMTDDYTPNRDELLSHPLAVMNLRAQRAVLRFKVEVLVRQKGDTHQLVVSQSIRRTLFDNVHSEPLAGHFGLEKTLDQLKQAYFWPGMRKDVSIWYQQCADCFCGRAPTTKLHRKLHNVIVREPLDIVSVDILSGLPVTKDGYKYVLVLTDYFTKWTEAYPLKDAEAPTCIRVMYNSFCGRFGLPRQIHSDQGRNFESRLFQELCLLAGTRKSKLPLSSTVRWSD